MGNLTAPNETITKNTATLADYVRIARFDHMTKHVFIVPGIALAILLRPDAMALLGASIIPTVIVGFLAAIFVASANYVINEWLDREFDRFHPEKSQRAAVRCKMSGRIIIVQYMVLITLGLGLASTINTVFFWAALLLAISGVTYNLKPIRTKDRVYLDVVSESINNPLRLLMGWTMVDGLSLPPISLLMAFWFGGAFLMNSKRLAEYRDIVASDGVEILARYRKSFGSYTENRLSVANLVYALSCAFFMAIFFIKYRIEYILVFPCIVFLFGLYYSLALTPDSVARKPEKLYRSWGLIVSVILTSLVFVAATFIDIPHIENLSTQHFIELGGAEAASN